MKTRSSWLRVLVVAMKEGRMDARALAIWSVFWVENRRWIKAVRL
jgi:hypothetical protein